MSSSISLYLIWVYHITTKVKNMHDHWLPKQAWNTRCKVQKTNKSSKALDIMKWFTRWVVKDLLELWGDVMKYMIIEDRSLRALRMKWQDAKISIFEYYIANMNNIGPNTSKKCYDVSDRIFGSRRSLTLLQTRSHKLKPNIVKISFQKF